MSRRCRLTNDVQSQPDPGMRRIYRHPATLPKVANLLHEQLDVLQNDGFLVAEGASAEGVGQGSPLLGVDDGIADANDARLVQLVQLVPRTLEEASLPVFDVAVDVTVGLGRGEG